jgi:hypothetical protein
LLGTVQGLILGPVIYAIFVSPLFDLEDLFAFADNTFIPRIGENSTDLIRDMERSLETTTKYMKKSGFNIKENKTKLNVFYKNDVVPWNIRMGDKLLSQRIQ